MIDRLSRAALLRVLYLTALAALPALPATTPAQTPAIARTDSARDLRDIFAPGYILQDRNHDGVIDFLNAKIVRPASPSEADVAAAANVAARLGYETSAADLDLTTADAATTAAYDVPVILIGRGNALIARAAPSVARALDDLAPGQGAAVLIPPNDFFREGGVLLAGEDGSGLIAIADYFSSRYPSIWALHGDSYGDIDSRLSAFLAAGGAAPRTVSLDRIVIDAGHAGVNRAQLAVRLPDSAAYARAVAALEAPDTGAAHAGARGARPGGRPRRADLDFADLDRLDVMVSDGTQRRTLRLLPAHPWQTKPDAEYAVRDNPDFTLSDLYTIRGLFRDSNQDLVPDRTDAYVSLHGTQAPDALAAFSARVGLETPGMRLPFVQVSGQNDHPETAGFPIMFGVGHYQTERLREAGKLVGDTTAPAEGSMRFVKGAFGGKNGMVIDAADRAGLDAITDYAATRMPYLWEYGKGNYQLSDVETQVRRFFQAREAPGQTALAVVKLGQWLDRLKGKAVDSIGVEIAAKDRYAGLDRYAEQMVHARFPDAKVTVLTQQTGFGVGKMIFTQEATLPWEVNTFWKDFREQALPKLTAASRGRIEVRLSESPAERAKIAEQIRRELAARGVASDAFDVQVLSAYKQGYSWLHDEILPQLLGKRVGRIEITYRTLKDSKEVKWSTVESDTRWLQELYPIDDVMARTLGISDSAITFTPTQHGDSIYTVRALAPDGHEILAASFSPRYVIRPMFDLFPAYEHVRVTTGWVHVVDNGRTVLDQRVETDPETFWDYFQQKTYPRIADYFMDVQHGRPSQSYAPYFDELNVDLAMSEPSYRIGIDEEQISSLEAIHEDIYFETLTLFDLLGGRWGIGSVNYPGRIIPHIAPPVDGQPPHLKITFTGKDNAVPRLVMAYREHGRDPVRDRYDLSPLPVETPPLRGISVRAGASGVAQLTFHVTALDSSYRWDDYRLRGTEESVDRQLLPATLLAGMVRAMADLHAHGVAERAMSFDRVGNLLFHVTLQDTTARFATLASLPRGAHPMSTARPVLLARNFRYTGQRLVQWNNPIPPPESDSVLAELATFPGVHPYWVGRSFLGKDIFAADFLPPMDSRFVSQAKLDALKPTLLLSGRQHANEVSSTSYILRLGELLATDTNYSRLLRKVNVVLHPIMNADGAQLAYDLQKVTPDFMVHAGYLGALGVDATTGAGTEDPVYPESNVRPLLQQTWLPDIYMNLHGYPSHEWVQLFAGYSAWVRGRTGEQRQWWSPRGWFVPGFTYVDDPAHPQFERAQFAILDSVAAAITGDSAVNAMDQRLYARYRKYGEQDTENFRQYFNHGILVYQALRGRPLDGGGRGGRGGPPPGGAAAAALNSPRISYFSLVTEAPDETAHGAWLHLVAGAGLTETSALLRYLAEGVNEIRRDNTAYAGFVNRAEFRVKPVLPRDSTAH